METTPNLKMPYILPSQAQKHVTHNEALRYLDALLHLSVTSRQYTSPPVNTQEGERYLVPAGAADSWQRQDGNLAAFMDAEWFFFTPLRGWTMYVADENVMLVYNGAQWQSLVNPQPMVGVNTEADSYNRFAVASDAVLLTHTASLLFQSGWTGYAEMGLAGENNFSIKVADDAGQWRQALRIDRVNGNIAIGSVWPTAALHVDGALRLKNYEASALPDAVQSGAGAMAFVKAGQGIKPAFSDGVQWRWMQDSQPVGT